MSSIVVLTILVMKRINVKNLLLLLLLLLIIIIIIIIIIILLTRKEKSELSRKEKAKQQYKNQDFLYSQNAENSYSEISNIKP